MNRSKWRRDDQSLPLSPLHFFFRFRRWTTTTTTSSSDLRQRSQTQPNLTQKKPPPKTRLKTANNTPFPAKHQQQQTHHLKPPYHWTTAFPSPLWFCFVFRCSRSIYQKSEPSHTPASKPHRRSARRTQQKVIFFVPCFNVFFFSYIFGHCFVYILTMLGYFND